MDITSAAVRGAEAPPSSFEALCGLVRSRGLRFAELWFTDLSGRPWRIAMPTDALTEDLFAAGLPLDGQPVGGDWDGVMLLMPRFDAAYPDPAAEAPTLALFCDVLDVKTKEPRPLEPRHVLKRAVRLASEKLGATLNLGAEPEFMLLKDGHPVPESVLWDFLRALALALGDSGVDVDWFRFGPAPGQGRVQMRAGAPLQLADRVLLYRHAAAGLARKRGLTVSFLPRPVSCAGTPGMPFHMAVWKDGRNLFHGEDGWALTSPVCRGWAGGLLAHLPELLAFCAPTTNSYRRLIAGRSGPVEPLLSTERAGAACRIPARSTAPAARRVKFCCPDSTANPYLAFAATIVAGLDGVERGLPAPVDGQPPLDVRLPHSLEQALDALSAARGLFTANDVFSDELLDAWIRDRWEKHALPVRRRPHPAELEDEGGRP